MKMNKSDCVSNLCPPLDFDLVKALVDEFISQERRYVLGDWEPSTLDGGQFAEIAGRIIYHVDSGNLSRSKELRKCLSYIEDVNNSNTHNFNSRKPLLLLCRVLRTIYKLRSQRGAIHIDLDYNANELDATVVISIVRWVMAEILRLFWSGDTQEVAQAIKEIVRFPVPAILSAEERHLVLRTDCTVEEEILILLHNAGEVGMTRKILGKSIPKNASTISKALSRLLSSSRREILQRTDGTIVLTALGMRRIREELSSKLTIG